MHTATEAKADAEKHFQNLQEKEENRRTVISNLWTTAENTKVIEKRTRQLI